MGTRARIGIQENGVIQSVYLHWDGYPEHAGKILKKHFKDVSLVKQLIELGDMSVLAPTIGEKHDFNVDIGVCKFYGRDRGETGVKAKTAKTLSEFHNQTANCGGEHCYLMVDGEWQHKRIY